LNAAAAIELADARAVDAGINLADFERPTATYSIENGRGIWHMSYSAPGNTQDSCFGVDIEDDNGAAALRWCA
jgi:hypothetical protein